MILTIKRTVLAFCGFAIIFPFQSQAQQSENSRTLSVFTQPIMASGKLAGCSLVFEGLAHDYPYRKGKVIKLDGSVNILGMGENTAVTLKIVVNELLSTESGMVVYKPSSPSRVYLVGSDLTNNNSSIVSVAPTDVEGGIFAVFNLSPAISYIIDGLLEKKLTIAFNQMDGGMDIVVPINLTVAKTTRDGKSVFSDQIVNDFLVCSQSLLSM